MHVTVARNSSRAILLIGSLGALAGCMASPPLGTAELRDAAGNVVGLAILTQVEEGIRIQAEVRGLAPGTHGFHIHANGKCESPDFASASSHFNPTGRKHGHQNPEGAHAGDMPNLEVGRSGTGSIEVVAKSVTLAGSGPTSLFKAEGTALVVHAIADDYKTDPAGNAGKRIGCGVVVSNTSATP